MHSVSVLIIYSCISNYSKFLVAYKQQSLILLQNFQCGLISWRQSCVCSTMSGASTLTIRFADGGKSWPLAEHLSLCSVISSCGLSIWCLQSSGLKVITFLIWDPRAPRESLVRNHSKNYKASYNLL